MEDPEASQTSRSRPRHFPLIKFFCMLHPMSMMMIGEAVVDDEILHERFSCELEKCRGACCTLPGCRGAPLEDDEIGHLEEVFPMVEKYLPEAHLGIIRLHGLAEGSPGNYATTTVGERECVFVYYEDGIARCSIEKAYLAGETDWRKPISCHLFPIRVSNVGQEKLHYEKIKECQPGRDRGALEDTPVYAFLKESLERKFGSGWYEQLAEAHRSARVAP